ncbi:MAG TPA: VWA domain-containing protein [Thermoanaerobaculia bacterium]|nr:VWA domain-containing protein [Thermoanaerobaculia bacterium]
MRPRIVACLLLLLPLLAASAQPAAAASRKERKEQAEKIAHLAQKYQQWLQSVELLITDEEKKSFLDLEEDYQRDAFIDKFWRSRDPYPETARNELKDKWDARLEEAQTVFGSVADERARFMLLNGPPAARIVVRCATVTWPAEVWFYSKENRTHEELYLIFYQRYGAGEFRMWEPLDGVGALLQDSGGIGIDPAAGGEQAAFQRIREGCIGESGDALVAAVAKIYAMGKLAYPLLMMKAAAPLEHPSGEWLATFASYSTDLPAGAGTFPATLEMAYPGRQQSRTVLQATVKVAVADLGFVELGGARSYNLLLTGEVLRGGQLFDRFRYKFDFPASDVGAAYLPLVIQRPLRPGDYRLVLKVEDVDGKKFFRSEQVLTVPVVEGAVPPPLPSDPETARMLAEANALLANGDTTIKLLAPVGQDMLAGKKRFDALVTGDQVGAVVFALDGQPILTKRAPPWSVELDLGHLPRSQTLRATATDASGKPLASDELVVNASAHRFAVTITEPAPKQHFSDSVRLVAKVEVPEGQHIERLEIYRDETLVTTLYQPPFEQPILLPQRDQLTYLRAVAYLPDGSDTDDHVFINAPPGLEEVAVQLVELYTAVTDRNGRPAEGLTEASFGVREDGAPQQLVRFEQVRDLPIKTAVLLDTSASMDKSMEEAQRAALEFFTDIVTPKDRAALITFNDRPRLQVKFTNELIQLGGGLAGLKAERGTALYDSIVFALYYFNGLKGQRALIVLSDGKDESSKFKFEDTLEFARRAGVAIYTIGLGKDLEREAKKALEKLAGETGGRSFFVDEAKELSPIYQSIQEELRSQYLLVYQSTNAKPDKKFRTVDVKVKEPGLEAHTIRGYYP